MNKPLRPSLDEVEYYLVRRGLQLLLSSLGSNEDPIALDICRAFDASGVEVNEISRRRARFIHFGLQLRLEDLILRVVTKKRGKRRLLWKRHFGGPDLSFSVERIEEQMLDLVRAIEKGKSEMLEALKQGKSWDAYARSQVEKKEES